MADMVIYDSLVTRCHCTVIINLSSDGDLENSLETKNLLNFLKTLVLENSSFYKLVIVIPPIEYTGVFNLIIF